MPVRAQGIIVQYTLLKLHLNMYMFLHAFMFIFEAENRIKLSSHKTGQINHPISFLFKKPITIADSGCYMKRTDLRLLYIHVNNWWRIQHFGSETSLAVIDKQSVMFFLEFNHDTLTIWYQIDQCHFAYTTESLVRYLKLCGLLTQTSIFSTSYWLHVNGKKAFHRTFKSQFDILQWQRNWKKFLS